MVRMNTIASNLANLESKAGAEDAYKPVRPIFETVFSNNTIKWHCNGGRASGCCLGSAT